MQLVAYLLGLLAACSNAGANILQRGANRDEDNEDEQFSLQMVRNLLTNRMWFGGIGCMTLSFVFQAVGLGMGSLAGVEPVLVLELPLTMVASALWLHEGLDRRAWMAVAGMTVSTVVLIAALGPRAGRTTGIPVAVWVVAGVITLGAIGASYGLGLRFDDPTRRSAVLGIGTGACFGLAASMVKGMTTQFSSGGFVGALESWQLYAAILAGALAVWMQQNAVSAARLVVAQPGITLGDPYVSILWGAFVFAEPMRSGWWIALAVAAGIGLTASAVGLSQTQAAEEAGGDDEDTGPDEPDRTDQAS